MGAQIKPIPEGYHTVTPHLTLKGADQAIEFYRQAFGAELRCRLPGPDGKTVGHAEITIGDSYLMLADESPAFGNKSPQSLGGSPVSFAIYVPDADAAFARAVAAGAKVVRPMADQFYGDRTGTVADPFGYIWSLMTHIEDVDPEEIKRRMEIEYSKMTH